MQPSTNGFHHHPAVARVRKRCGQSDGLQLKQLLAVPALITTCRYEGEVYVKHVQWH